MRRFFALAIGLAVFILSSHLMPMDAMAAPGAVRGHCELCPMAQELTGPCQSFFPMSANQNEPDFLFQPFQNSCDCRFDRANDNLPAALFSAHPFLTKGKGFSAALLSPKAVPDSFNSLLSPPPAAHAPPLSYIHSHLTVQQLK